MKTRLILVLLFFVVGKSYSQYFPVDTTRLNQTYNDLIKAPFSFEKEKAFLDAFPSTFSEYIMVYQYVPDPNYDLTMYHKGLDHVLKGLGGLKMIPDTIFCDKLIKLSLNGRWNADAPNYLKMLLHQVIEKKPEIMFERLNKMMIGQQFSFWYFYFSSLSIKEDGKTNFQQIKMQMEKNYSKEIKDMEAAYQAAYGKAFLSEDFPHKKIKGEVFK
jgi:hypothetical protein